MKLLRFTIVYKKWFPFTILFQFVWPILMLSMAALISQHGQTIPPTALPGVLAAEDDYLSQEDIDWQIQQAFFKLNTATAVAGHGFKIEEAIQEAKAVASRLKNIAETDPNGKYILWKVSELEYQLFLEENDLLRAEQEKSVKKINRLLDNFNAEQAKDLPDFATLESIVYQINSIDNAKALEVQDVYNYTLQTIAENIPTRIENALDNQHFDKARTLLDYCINNRAHIRIAPSEFGRFEAKLQSQINASDIKAFIKEDFQKVTHLLRSFQIREAQNRLKTTQRRFDAIRNSLTTDEINSFHQKQSYLFQKMIHLEDSLVQSNLQLLESSGIEAAKQFLETRLIPLGVSSEKIAIVDQAIIKSSLAVESSSEPFAMQTTVMKEDATQSMLSTEFSGLKERARKIAKHRADSIRSVMLAMAQEALKDWQKQNKRYIRKENKLLAQAREMRREAIEENKELVDKFIEKSSKVTIKMARKPLKANLKLSALYDEFLMKQDEYRFELDTKLREIQSEVKEVRAEQTKKPTSSLTPQLVQNFPDIFKKQNHDTLFTLAFLDKYQIPTVSFLRAREADIFKKGMDKTEWAQKSLEKIYKLLEKNKINQAWSKFSAEKDILHKYVYSEAYEILRITVEQAYQYVSYGK